MQFRGHTSAYVAVKTWFEKRKYSPRTRAEYLRKLGAQVGEDCFIIPTDIETEIDPHLLIIGNHVAIAAGVSFLDEQGSAWLFPGSNPEVSGQSKVVINNNCFIGTRAILGRNISIGPNSVVGAGSLVVSDVPSNTVVMGVPARPFGSLDKYQEKCIQRWAQQRPPGAVIEPGETWWTSRHHTANRELLKNRLTEVFHHRLS